jgi:thiol:disulfide interchange protein DsbC
MSLKTIRLITTVLAVAFAAGVTQAQAPAQAQSGSATKPAAAQAATAGVPAAAKADPRAVIVKKMGDIKLEDVRMTPVNGIYEVTRDAEISYLSSDGRYAIVGDMFDLDSGDDVSLSEIRRRGIRARIIDNIPETEMLVFAPKETKYTVTVFTDIDCGYCRRLHSQIAEYNRLGIRVRYLFFPRTGPNTESWHKAEAVWCSANRNDALTRAKNGEAINAPKCPTNIINRDFELGQKLQVDGTPAILLASGEMLPGYAPPGELAKYLKQGNKK